MAKINTPIKLLLAKLAGQSLKNIEVSFGAIPTVTKSFGEIKTALLNNGFNLATSEDDYTFFFTSWENWKEMLAVITNIIGYFKWQAECADCDNRADLVSALASILFKFNTCGNVRCRTFNRKSGKTFLHRCNLIIDQLGDTYLFDIDNKGQYIRIENEEAEMGDKTYTEFEDAQYH